MRPLMACIAFGGRPSSLKEMDDVRTRHCGTPRLDLATSKRLSHPFEATATFIMGERQITSISPLLSRAILAFI